MVRSNNFNAEWMHYKCALEHCIRQNQPMKPPVRIFPCTDTALLLL